MKQLLKYTLVSLLLLSFTNGYSQENFSLEDAKITQYEMTMTEYSKDKDAEALVIFEKGKNYFRYYDNQGFQLIMEHKIKIKVLKQAGIEYADFEIPYYIGGNVLEDVSEIKGVTYNYDDGVLSKTELVRTNIFDEKLPNEMRMKKFTMPNVKEGSIIEVSYTHTTPYFSRMDEWKFQKKIPVNYSNLEYRATPFFEYAYILKGRAKFDKASSEMGTDEFRIGRLTYKEMIFNFGMESLPAFKDEEFITSPRDYMVSLNMQLAKTTSGQGITKEFLSTWPKICEVLLKEDTFGKYLKNSEKEAKKILPTLGLEGKSQTEQMKIISDYVKTNYKWNSSVGKFAQTDKLSDFLKNKTGNSGNINLFLTGLLRGAGLDANPVILSTRDHGRVSRDHPFESFMNYVVANVKIDGKNMTLDATEPLLHYNELPNRCINVEGLLVSNDKKVPEQWFFIEQNILATTLKKIKVAIMPQQRSLHINATYVAFGNDAYSLRKIYQDESYDLKEYLKRTANINVAGKVETSNFEDKDKPFTFNFECDLPIEMNGDKIFIEPFCGLSERNNLFTQKSRSLLVDLVFYGGNSYESEIEIPEGYKVEYLPKSIVRNTPIMNITYSSKVEGNKILINAEYTMNASIFKAEVYPTLKNIFGATIDKFKEMIVLVKE